MSVQSEINRISGNVTAALTAIAEKGVAVDSGSNSDDLATLIAAIEAGGGATSIAVGTITMAEQITASNTDPLTITHNLGVIPKLVFFFNGGTPSISSGLHFGDFFSLLGETIPSTTYTWVQKFVRRGSSSSSYSVTTQGGKNLSTTVTSDWTSEKAVIPLSGSGTASFVLESGATYIWVVCG